MGATLGKHGHLPFARLHKGPHSVKAKIASRGASVAPYEDIHTVYPQFKKGARVNHTGGWADASHGEGKITCIGSRPGKEGRKEYVRVKFDNGEIHEFLAHSLHKLKVVPGQPSRPELEMVPSNVS